jgi:hypothetical protein
MERTAWYLESRIDMVLLHPTELSSQPERNEQAFSRRKSTADVRLNPMTQSTRQSGPRPRMKGEAGQDSFLQADASEQHQCTAAWY